MEKIPLWLDCDTGHDDAYAILLAAFHPLSNLLGVSTVHGNAPLERTTPNTLAVLQAIGKDDIPVVQGSPRPMSPTRAASFATSFHGESGLDGVSLPPTPSTSQLIARQGTQWIHDIAETILGQESNRVRIVPTGPLTNIALLFRERPEVVEHIAGVSLMGGAIGGGFTDAPLGRVSGDEQGERFGNWSRFAEFNIFCDPEAANFILSNPRLAHKTTMATLDLTHQCRATPAVRSLLFGDQYLRRASGSPSQQPQQPRLTRVRELFRETLLFFTAAYATGFNITDGPPLHDPVAVYAALQPELFDDRGGERWIVTVDEDGQTVGQTVLRRPDQDREGVRVPRAMDLEAFWKDINESLGRAENVVAQNDL